MGLFWKRTKKQEAEAAQPPQPSQSSQSSQSLPPSPAPEPSTDAPENPPEQKAGFFQRIFNKAESAPAPPPIPPTAAAPPTEIPPEAAVARAPEQEKKSIWNRLGLGAVTAGETGAAQPARSQETEDV